MDAFKEIQDNQKKKKAKSTTNSFFSLYSTRSNSEGPFFYARVDVSYSSFFLFFVFSARLLWFFFLSKNVLRKNMCMFIKRNKI